MAQASVQVDYSIGARVSQIARVRGQDVGDIIREVQPSIGVVLNSSSWLDADYTRRCLESRAPRKPVAEVADLVRRAFRLAQDSGKPEWATMSLPVLKNRLLSLTDGEFDETDFGAPNMGSLVRSLPDVVNVIEARPHDLVTLIAEPDASASFSELAPQRHDERARARVRSDLWQATMDFRSRVTYVWDEGTSRARVLEDGETGAIVFPTITPEELSEWRAEFASSVAEIGDQDLITTWAKKGLPTGALPPAARGAWNAFLKDHAEERLRAFFLGNGIDLPGDLMSESQLLGPESRSKLRRLLHASIDQMTEDELRALWIPAVVLARLHL